MERDFEFTYSAPEQEEVRRIREKYLPAAVPGKLEQLRALDAGVTRKGTVWSIGLGTGGTVLFGGGMSLCLVWEALVWGIPLGMAGMVLMGLAYPVFRRITARERERIAPEVLRLSEELLNP